MNIVICTQPALKPNVTAWFVVQSLLAAGHHPHYQRAIKKEARVLYEILANEGSNIALLCKIIHHLPYSWQFKIFEFLTVPGRIRHFILRKNAIEAQAREWLAESPKKQVVILGAGLDILSLRLAVDFPQVNFIEIDMEESQRFKTSVLHSHHVAIPSNVEYLSGDLSKGLHDVIKRSRYVKETPTLWIAEGLLMFLPENNCRNLFKEIHALSIAEATVIFTTLSKTYQGSWFARNFQKIYLRKKKSDFKWTIAPNDVPRFMEELGYDITKQIVLEALHKDYITPHSRLIDELGDDIHVAVCQ